ncbi:rotA [Symbiodinium natans]|uniref:peptidylprolyl isomerase n=1 Tax=Symbiodinium natans TaxID=878477 RepID=A0A812NYG0_9DINO|nr:rotA [Symbiodinium natans]
MWLRMQPRGAIPQRSRSSHPPVRLSSFSFAIVAVWLALDGHVFVGNPRCQRDERKLVASSAAPSGYIPGVGSLSDETRTVSLQPGSLGMEVDPESGLVKQVFEDGAAERAGVQAGWIFQTVSGKPYELLTLKALLRGEEPFEATFGVLRPNPVAVLDTSLGVIEAEIFLDRVPRTASNFIDLAQSGFYDGVHFHRVIPNFMIQFGCPNAKDPSSPYAGTGGPSDGSFQNLATGITEKRFRGGNIKDEFLSEDSNVKGTLSMANTGQPDSGGSQFFINVRDNTFLDWFSRGDARHPVFGKVIKGYDVAVKISKVYTQNDRPVEPVMMKSVIVTT